MVSYEDNWLMRHSLLAQCDEMRRILPTDILSDSDATKDNVIERVTSGSASLVHFLVHGTPVGKGGRPAGRLFLSTPYRRRWQRFSSTV